MSEISQEIQKAILDSLEPKELGEVDVVAVPKSKNRLIQLRTLEEVIDDFDMDQSPHSFTYVVKVKPTKQNSKKTNLPDLDEIDMIASKDRGPRDIYQSSGKLNKEFLIENAEILIRSQNFKDAKKIYETLTKSGFKSARILNGIGLCNEKEGLVVEAQDAYEEAIAFESSLRYYRNLYRVLKAQNRKEYALEVLDRALAIENLSSKEKLLIHKELGKSWTDLKNFGKAKEHFLKAREIAPKSDDVMTKLGSIALKVGELDQAITCFEKSEELNSVNSKAIFGLGCCHLIKGDQRMAHRCFVDSLKIDINNPTAVYYLTKCAYELKKYDEAVSLVNEFVRSAPVNANLLYCLAGMQFHTSQYPDALQTLEKLLSVRPEHSGGLKLKHLVLNQMR